MGWETNVCQQVSGQELIISYEALKIIIVMYVEDFGGGEIQKDTRVKLRLWHLGAGSKCS